MSSNGSGSFTGVRNKAVRVPEMGVGDLNVGGALSVGGRIDRNLTPVAINGTATATAADVVGGLIISTSGAPTTITLPSAADIMALIPGGGIGTTVDFYVDNTQGGNTVTISLHVSIALTTSVITGSSTLTTSTNNSVAMFRLYFYSGTGAIIHRMF